MNINELWNKYHTLDLPTIQKEIIYHERLIDLLADNRLCRVINPAFSYHYCVAEIKPNNDVITTRDTDGYCEAWGNQSKDAETNAFQLAEDIKALLLSNGAYLIGKKYFIRIDGIEFRIPGMTQRNTIPTN